MDQITYNNNSQVIPAVDTWQPEPHQIIFSQAKNIIICNTLADYYHIEPNNPIRNRINILMLNTKKSYNSDDLRYHYCQYVNYFEAFFDLEKEYYTNFALIKFCTDSYQEYSKENFLHDINKYIIQPSIVYKVGLMVEHNYNLSLSYKSANNPQLQYTNDHAKVLLHMSILMNLCIPLITHYASMKRITDIDEFILDVYDNILYYPDFYDGVDINSKLFQTSKSNVDKNAKNNAAIWGKQDIRGKDVITHSKQAVRNIELNIMPKYTFEQNMISLNYTSIQKNNKYQVTDIAYEFNYIPLSSAAGDGEDNASELDKYEANLSKADESFFLQSKYNCSYTIQKIEKMWGPFDDKEIDFYIQELSNENGEIMNGFQKQLIFNLFYKYFGDTVSPNAINARDYIKLMLAAKKMLLNNRMGFFPYIISSKIEKVVARKTLNKKELMKLEASQYYPQIQEKYRNEKTQKLLLGTIATIITSNFKIIDYDKNNDSTPMLSCNGIDMILHGGPLHGQPIILESDIVIEEVLLYTLLI